MTEAAAVSSHRLDRNTAFAAALLLAIAAALTTRIGAAVAHRGFATAVTDLFGISAIVWFAGFAICTIAREDRADGFWRPYDAAMLAAIVGAALLPVPAFGAAAVFGAGAWLALRSEAGSGARRIGLVALALSAHLLWGPLILKLLGSELLAFDARIAALFAGGNADGNIFGQAGSQAFTVGQNCSSLTNLSLAGVLAVTLAQLFALRFDRRLIVATMLAMVGTIIVNGIRLATIARHPDLYDYLHSGAGMMLFGWASLLVTAAIIGTAVARHPDFAPR
jgi:exosortase/archaeosortase family protein